MERITHRISLDTQKSGIQKLLQGFNTGEKVTRRVEISLTANGNNIFLPDTGLTALMYVTISGVSSANACVIEDGKAIYDLDDNDTSTAGIVNMQLKILDTSTGAVFYAPQFEIEVWENGIGSSTAATSETFTALESALAQAQLYSQSTIDSVYIDEDNIFTVEYKDGSKYTSTVIADAITAFEEATQEVGDLAEALSEAQEYASSASASATSASTSASNASTSATSASASATSASESATSASSSATSASASKEAAATSASNASASATSASQSATSATASKEAAASSASSASQSATSASTSASSATASKNAAATSATSASTSASSALASKTAAESAATRAEEAATQATQGQKQADYEQTDDTQKDFIKNKPIIDILTSTSPTHTLSTSRGGIRLDKVVGEIHKSANLLKPTLTSATTTNGVTITPLGDGTFLLNGTASAYTYFFVCESITLKANVTYRVVGTPPNSGMSGNKLFRLYGTGGQADLGSGNTFSYDADKSLRPQIAIASGLSFNNDIFKPMLVNVTDNPDLADITYSDYEPYGVLTSGSRGYFDGELLQGYYNTSNGAFTSSTSFVCSKNLMPCNVGDKVKIKCDHPSVTNIYVYFFNGTSYVSVSTISNASECTVPSGCNGFKFAIRNSSGTLPLGVADVTCVTVNDNYAIVVQERNTDKGWYKYVASNDTTYVLQSGYVEIKTTTNGLPNANNSESNRIVCDKVSSDSTKSKYVTTTKTSIRFMGFTSVEEVKALCPITIEYLLESASDEVVNNVIIPISSPLTSYDSISEDGEYRAYGRVDLGSLTWTLQSGTPATRYYATFADIVNGKNGAIVCASYETITQSEWVAFSDGIGTREIADNNHRILICDSTVDGDVDALKAKLNGILAYYEKATPTLTPLSTDQTIALHSLKAYDGKTYLDSADVYAKPTLSVGYSKVQSLAIENENLSKVNARLIEDLQSAFETVETESFSYNGITFAFSKNGNFVNCTVSGKTTAEISTSWAIVGVLDKAKSANALNGHFHANNGTCIKWQIYANGNFAITGLSSVASGVFVQDGFMYCTK